MLFTLSNGGQFSTPLGSGSLTILKASIMAGLIYAPGAALASNSTVNALSSDVGSGTINVANLPPFFIFMVTRIKLVCSCSLSKKINRVKVS